MWFVPYFAWLVVLMGMLEVFGYYSRRPISTWHPMHRLYFVCWVLITAASVVIGLGTFTMSPSYGFWSKMAGALQCVLLAIVPCGIKVFNTNGQLVLLRIVLLTGAAFILLVAAYVR